MRIAKLGLLGIASVVTMFAAAPDSAVVLGGAGPSPYFEQALDKTSDALVAAGVKVKFLSTGASARNALLDQMKDRGYRNLLYLTLDTPRDSRSEPSRGDLAGACFVDGAKVWEEEAKGPLALALGAEHEVESMLNSFVKKIGKHVGGPCLSK